MQVGLAEREAVPGARRDEYRLPNDTWYGGVTAPPVGRALPSRAGDPRTAPRAPDGRFLINSRDSPEPGSGREPGEPPRRSAAGCVRKRPQLESSGPGDRRPHASSEVVQPLGAITVVTTRLEVPMADLRGLSGSSTEKLRWQWHGACRGANPELFFHPDGKRGPGHRRREQAAAAICRGCPVVADCRAHALASPEPHGFWGGLSESEREAIRTGSAGDPARACCRQTPA